MKKVVGMECDSLILSNAVSDRNLLNQIKEYIHFRNVHAVHKCIFD